MDWHDHNDTIWPVSQIKSHTPTTTHVKKAHIRSHSETYVYTHLFLLVGPFKSISQQLSQSHRRERLMLSSCAWPLFMYVQWVRVEETIGGNGLAAGLAIPNLLLHAKSGVSDNHEGNFRWTNGRSESHHFVRMPLFPWNPTHPHEWHGELAVIEMSTQEGVLNFC